MAVEVAGLYDFNFILSNGMRTNYSSDDYSNPTTYTLPPGKVIRKVEVFYDEYDFQPRGLKFFDVDNEVLL